MSVQIKTANVETVAFRTDTKNVKVENWKDAMRVK
jgi:hypothetical protein